MAWDEIPKAYGRIAGEYGVPPAVLYAVALTESGQKLTTGSVRPWPWSLNVEGRPEYYASRGEAWQALMTHLAAGVRSIDIGLMQVNWRWHREALRDPWAALDPYFNLRVGASILRRRFEESRDWLLAAGRYHAPAATGRARHRAAAYRGRVAKRLKRLGGLGNG